ncbi:MAG: GNAT family N-acetyltransferase, partial [Planctomycetes bacterium]|nr:GNAT family N-acetyltransferase [Planctomycetota bacterium]
AESWRGQGWGKRLMEELIAEATRRGKKAITLIHVKQNAAAAALYRALGFHPPQADTGEHLGSDGNEYLQLKRTL